MRMIRQWRRHGERDGWLINLMHCLVSLQKELTGSNFVRLLSRMKMCGV
jgi:hypothetical protein